MSAFIKKTCMASFDKPALSAYFRRFATKIFISLLFIVSLTSVRVYADSDPKKGEELFTSNCRGCHNPPNVDKKLTGPSLKNIDQKHTEAWLIKWIRNNEEFRKSGDKDAIKIFEDNGKVPMNTFPSFSDDDIKNIIAYVKAISNVAPDDGGGETKNTVTENTENEGSNYSGILWIVVLTLLALSALIFRINRNLRRYAEEKNGDNIPHKSFYREVFSKGNVAFIIFIIVLYSGYWLVSASQGLGRSKGYQPIQPIKFSHAVHAGQNQINCLYCHAGAEKSKTASIPSAMICMNCHKAIDKGPRTGTEEIAKIYNAVGYNTTSGKYDGAQHPIKWIKIHNLPDHVYFNHAQHVKAGQIECQKCHGAIETMDEVQQAHSLSMGWCVNCHRETGVQFEQNKYYEPLFTKLHEELKSGKIDKVTEGEIGGTECQKCHY